MSVELSLQLAEIIGLASGLLCVWLLIRQNIYTWPVGIVYVLVSLWVFYQSRLYAELGLHVLFLVLNIYGWWLWSRGEHGAADDMHLPVTVMARAPLLLMIGLALLLALVMGMLLQSYTDADLAIWDSAVTTLSLVAIWLSANKKLQSWIIWLLVDLLATAIYLYKGLEFYALLYLVYLGLAVSGYLGWRSSMQRSSDALSDDARRPAT